MAIDLNASRSLYIRDEAASSQNRQELLVMILAYTDAKTDCAS